MEESTWVATGLVSLLLGALTVVYWLWQRLNVGQDTCKPISVTEGKIKVHQGFQENEMSCGGDADLHPCNCKKNPGHSKNRETGQDTLELARVIREHQGNHEAEVSCGGEADLHRHYKRCQKNPGHSLFIPVKDFKLEHLPPGYRDNIIMDWIRNEADLTCRLFSDYTSELRPRCYPDSPHLLYPFYDDRGGHWLRTGTGWVKDVNKFTEKDKKNCECEGCSRAGTHTPKKVWGEIEIYTACHVVYNTEEARHTTSYFSYDTSTTLLHKCRKLKGLKVKYSDIKGDMCIMTCVTHDMDLVKKLVKMCDRRLELFEKVRSKYWLDQWKGWRDPGVSHVTDPSPGHVVIISHPHGCSKQISIGEWTHRQTQEETEKYQDDNGLKAEYVKSSYRYNAATCPGSSGAPVIRLLEKGRVGWWWLLDSHPHSGGYKGNDNYSSKIDEFVSFPPTSSDTFQKSFLAVIVLGIFLCVIIVTYLSGDLKEGELLPYFCAIIIYPLCYYFIPFCTQVRWLQWSLVIFLCVFFLICLITFVTALVVDYHIVGKIMYGASCVIMHYVSVHLFKQAKSDPLTSYNIQCTLRRRTRVTVTTATKPLSSLPPPPLPKTTEITSTTITTKTNTLALALPL